MKLLKWLLGQSNRRSAKEADFAAERSRATPKSLKAPDRNVPKIARGTQTYPMEVVGESHYVENFEEICGGYRRDHQRLKVEATLVREPDNPYDQNAIAVEISGLKIGYLPRGQAQRVGRQMIRGSLDKVRCDGLIVGGWRTNQYDKGNFGVRLAIPTKGWIDLGIGAKPPNSSEKSSSRPRPSPAEDGPLLGHWIAIQGAPNNGEVAQELAGQGARIMAGVGKSTTMLVLVHGELELGVRSSASYRKAKKQVENGSPLEIISLEDLRKRIDQSRSRVS